MTIERSGRTYETSPNVVSVISPALAITVSNYVKPRSKVHFANNLEEIVPLVPPGGSLIVAFRGAEVLAELLSSSILVVQSVKSEGLDLIAKLTKSTSLGEVHSSTDFSSFILELNTSQMAEAQQRQLIVESNASNSDECKSLQAEIIRLRSENRKHRHRIDRVKNHSIGRIALNVYRFGKKFRR